MQRDPSTAMVRGQSERAGRKPRAPFLIITAESSVVGSTSLVISTTDPASAIRHVAQLVGSSEALPINLARSFVKAPGSPTVLSKVQGQLERTRATPKPFRSVNLSIELDGKRRSLITL